MKTLTQTIEHIASATDIHKDLIEVMHAFVKSTSRASKDENTRETARVVLNYCAERGKELKELGR